MHPKYPIYIISKGRWESRFTSKALERMIVPYRIVIEPQEFDQYASVIDPVKILVLPFSNLGQGSIPARNWVWEHSIGEGFARHWIVDDNIASFQRLNKSHRARVEDGCTFCWAEEFIDRYANIGLAGMQYTMFAVSECIYHGQRLPPFLLNTRIYSCILILNSLPQRWRGRYNEDTDLSLRVLKAGWCTVLFYAFLCSKQRTMTMTGGNTDELYRQDKTMDGRWLMAESLRKQHPDVVKVVRKWGRWQHQVDYRRFKRNKLKRKPGVEIPQGVNNYGMVLRKRTSNV